MTDRHDRLIRAGEALPQLVHGRRIPSPEEAERIAPAVTHLSAAEMAKIDRANFEKYHLANTPHHFAQAVADHPKVQDWAAHYLRNMIGAPSLMLLGKVGTGKTYQAYGALRYMAVSGWPTIHWRDIGAADLFTAMRPGGAEDPKAFFEQLATAPLLLLDDLGATTNSDFTGAVLYRLVDRRYTAGLPMIITSNVEADQFGKSFGDRTTSRLREMCVRVTLEGADRRRSPRQVA